MAADTIKDIARYSVEIVDVAINSVLTDQQSKQQFEDNLTAIAAVLDNAPKRRKVAKRHLGPPDLQGIFDTNILPKIRGSVAKHDEAENSAVDLEEKLNYGFVDEIANDELSDLATIKAVHAEIVEQERTASKMQLIVRYHRGLLYLNARKFMSIDDNVKEWFIRELNVAYATVLRYLRFAMLIQAYPRLIVCGLTFGQFSGHRNRLLNHFDVDRELACKLKTHVTVSLQDRVIDLTPADVEHVPKVNSPQTANTTERVDTSSEAQQLKIKSE